MDRRLRLLALAGVAVLLAAMVALVLTGRPRLEDDRDRADARWAPLRGPLAERYDRLDDVLVQLRDAGAGDRDVARDLDRTLGRWRRLQASSGNGDAGAEAETANALEGLSARLSFAFAASPRLNGVATLGESLDAFSLTAPPAPSVRAYNGAAERYQHTREGLLRRPVARLLGYEPLPTLLLSR